MLVPCATCGAHVRDGGDCPSCGATPRLSRAPSTAALLLGLALAGAACPSPDQPLYGAPATDLGDADADTDADTDETGDTAN